MAKRLPGIQRHRRDGTPVEAAATADPEAAKGGARKGAAKATSSKMGSSKAAVPKAGASKAATPKSRRGRAPRPEEATTSPATQAPAEVLAGPVAPAAALPGGAAIVRRHAVLAAAGGAVPLPVVDIAAVAGAQVAMVAELCRHYDTAFSGRRTRTIVYALLGSVGPYLVGAAATASFVKTSPVVGAMLGAGTMSAVAAAVTVAMGNTFLAHFENGGTLADAEAEGMKEGFRASLRAAREGKTGAD